MPRGTPTELGRARRRPHSDIRAQRMRLLHAFAELAWEEGIAQPSPGAVCRLAGVPLAVHEALFAGPEDCVSQALEVLVEHARERVARVTVAGADPAERIRASLRALLGLLEDEPELARLCLFQSLALGAEVRAARERALGELAAELERLPAGACADQLPRTLVATAVVGAMLAVVQSRLTAPRPAPLVDSLSELMGIVVLPYMGREAARRELAA